jgi:hypothetical protein
MGKTRILPVLALVAAGCASTGSTYRSGVADRFLEHAPYYAGARPVEGGLAVLPIAYQRGGSQAALFDPAADAGTPIAALLAEMNAYLGTLNAGAPLAGEGLAGTPPDVHFGCEVDVGGECTNGPAAPFDWGEPRMRLAVGRPSEEWISGVSQRLETARAGHALVITLEVGQYWPRQTNWRGSKAVELGTDHTAGLAWLTSLETPVSVLQLTGVIVGQDGLARRIGAEGLIARRTGIIAAGFGAQALISDEDVERIRMARREDLAGNPLVWQVALRTLVSQLSGLQLID